MALRRTGAGTEAQVEDLTAQVKTLESAIASAEARRKAAEARLDDLIVRAPFDGRLGTRSVSLGAYVSPGTRITTLDDLSRVRLDFAVPENVLDRAEARPDGARHLGRLRPARLRGQGLGHRPARRSGDAHASGSRPSSRTRTRR